MEADFAKLSFPKLVEITGHILLYRVDGLRTLRHIFPNLAVIRGQELFHNYAIAAYQMQDLEELGLVSLTAIKRGAVRLEKNSKLCYVDTIDWAKLAASDNWKDNVFSENKDEQECVNICAESCLRSTVDGKNAKRCWNSKDCQKGLDCEEHCGKGVFCNGTTCCHHYCLGGCRGTDKVDCLACKAVIYQGICQPRCNPETYKYMDRRCLLDKECMNMENHQKGEEWKIIRGVSGKAGDSEKEGKCIKECPNGYTKNTTTPNIRECTKCSAHCPKVCFGRVIDSIDAAQTLTGCTSITGPLEIEIDGGSNIMVELEKSLGEIEEVSHYIKITRSYPIISLHFFKKLKVIKGEKLDQSYYSLNIFDNPNLQELFLQNITRDLKILNGKAKFNFNRKLCFYKIENFLSEVGIANNTDALDDVKSTNGDSIPCEVNTLNLSVQDVSHHSVILKWDQFKTHDIRPLLSYVVHYREVQSKNVNIFQGRDACSESVWKTKEVEPDKNSNPEEFISSLRPWTLYAAYIQTYTIGGASSSAISNVTYFTTLPYYPSAPTNLEITAEVEGELKVTWDPPKLPNGNITHYIVKWRRQLLKREEFDKRDYCKEPLDLNRDKKEKDKKKEEAKKNLTLPSGGQCCRCPKTPQEEEEENRIRLNEIAFENALHDEVYVKRSENDMGLRRKREVPSQKDIQTGKQKYIFGNTNDEDVDEKRLRGKVGGKNSSSSNNDTDTENISIVRSQDIHLPNLGHSQPYTVEVVACLSDKDKNGKDMCSHSHSQGNSAIANARTLASKTADTINASTISIKINRTEVTLTWAEPRKPNGLVIKFEIDYKNIHNSDEYRASCINYTKYHSISGYKLENLQPGNYSFKIRATSLAGPGEWTPVKYFFIENTGSNGGIDQKVIIAIVIGVILVLVITIIVVWFVAKNRFAKESELANNLIVSHNPNYFPAGDVYIPDDWEVDRDKIELIREIGEGSFGMVYEGIVTDLPPYKGPMNIAVKAVNDQAGVQDKMNFLKEACIMKAFSSYHVVKLLGVVSQGQPAYVIMELMKNGDLKNYLRSHRPDVEDNNGAPPPTLKEILQMAGEIADGMAYLADKKFVHRDLAARNCMVAEDNTVKIGDFGMTRDIYMTDYYRKGGKGLLPVRWMAPESLKDGIFTTMSDVWSYGVVLWEMATLAAQPYQGLSNEEVLRYVSEGKFMEKPEGCPDRLYDLMLKCWQYKDKNRPTFKEIIEMLVPDLHPSFKDVSYFFSDENKPPDGPEFNDVMEDELQNIDIDMYQGDLEHPNYFNLQDESTIPFIEDCDKEEANSSPSRTIHPSTSGPCECVMLEELGEVKTHRASNCSSPNSALGNSDGSKESSKSSDGSYTQRNGLANGHIHLRLPRTTTC